MAKAKKKASKPKEKHTHIPVDADTFLKFALNTPIRKSRVKK